VVAPVASARDRAEDSLITIRVKYALTDMPDHAEIDFTHIKVVTDRRVVYLMGIVSRTDADQVVERARRVRGVAKVVKLFEYSD
jgi:osmotically-inducible protein OsmY